MAPHPRHLEASVLSCSSVNISRKSLYVDAASPDFLPGLCLFALSYSSIANLGPVYTSPPTKISGSAV